MTPSPSAATLSAPLPAMALTGSLRFVRRFAWCLCIGFVLLTLALFFLPWRQFVGGSGRVIAFNPLDRRINVEAQVAGRVKHLLVVEGQRVKKGDLIAEVQDNDPNLIQNLRAQREAIESRRDFAQGRVESLIAQITQQELAKNEALDAASQRVAATKIATETALANYSRSQRMHQQGLLSTQQLEQSVLLRDSTSADYKSAEATLKRTRNDFDASIASTHALKGSAHSDVATAERDLSAIDIQINQNLRQLVDAPRDGIVLQVSATDGTYLRPGSLICVIIPETDSRYVEVWVDGNDMPLIKTKTEEQPGSSVRLSFEGWPSVQLVGWPQIARGTFGGEVVFVDPTDDGKGKFRVVVGPREDVVDGVTVPWPEKERWLRQGARANALILLEEVPLWYELWRQINGFPTGVTPDSNLDPAKKG